MNAKTPSIKSRELSFGYGGLSVVDNISFELYPGETLTIAGPNGSGKTTLLHLLCGLLKQSSGGISIFDNQVSTYSKEALARKVSLMPQYLPYTPWLTVEEIVELGKYSLGFSRLPFAYGFRPCGKEAGLSVLESLEKANVVHLAGSLSGELSGGELRRVHLARVLAQNSQIVLLDEPASDLDIHHQALLIEIVRELAEAGKTVVLVTHDLNFAAILGGDMMILDKGGVIAYGKPENILRESNLAAIYPGGFRITEEKNGMPLVFPHARCRIPEGGLN